MRKSFRELSALVRNQLQQDPLSDQYFVFVNRRKTQIEMLYSPPHRLLPVGQATGSGAVSSVVRGDGVAISAPDRFTAAD